MADMSFGASLGAPSGKSKPATKFRIAILGDFSGRANRGELGDSKEIGKRKPVKVEFDELEEVMEKLEPKLRIPVGSNSAAVELEFTEMEHFHPDHVYGEAGFVEEALSAGRRLERAYEKAVGFFKGMADEAPDKVKAGPARGRVIPLADELSDLAGIEPEASAPEDLDSDDDAAMRAIVGRAAAPLFAKGDPDEAVLKALGKDLGNRALRQVLHHADFQALEGNWRGLEFLLRRTDKGGNVKVVLFDVSAEEFAKDLAGSELEETGIFELLVNKTAEGVDPDPWSAVVGLYEFGYTKAHAELVARMSRIARRLHAPFLSSLHPSLLVEKPKVDEAAEAAWEAFRDLPEAAYVALGLPGFLLRRLYGFGGEEVEAFDFKEWTKRAGTSCYPWGNPAYAAVTLLATSYMKAGGWTFKPNERRQLDKIPMHIYRDEDGDPVGVTTMARFPARVAKGAADRGMIPLVAVRNAESIQFAALRSMARGSWELIGKWGEKGEAAPPDLDAAVAAPAAADADDSAAPAEDSGGGDAGGGDDDLDALLAGLDDDDDDGDAGGDDDLDALLAGLDDDSDGGDDGDDDLDALLAGLDDDSGADDDLDALLAGLDD